MAINFNKEVEWNINQGFGIIILKLIDEVNEKATISDVEYFEAMRKLFRNIESIKKVDKVAMDEIDKKMLIASDKLNMDVPKSDSGKVFQKTVLKNVKRDLDTINRDLMRVINNAEIVKFHIDWDDPKLAMLK